MDFTVESMSCGHCVATLTRALQERDPSARLEADLAARVVRVQGALDADQVVAAMADAGYAARLRTPPGEVAGTDCCGSCRS